MSELPAGRRGKACGSGTAQPGSIRFGGTPGEATRCHDSLHWNGTIKRRAGGGRDAGQGGVVEQAFAVSLRPSQPGDDAPPVDPAAADRRRRLAARGIGRREALVAIGRTNIELRQLTMPAGSGRGSARHGPLPGVARVQRDAGRLGVGLRADRRGSERSRGRCWRRRWHRSRSSRLQRPACGGTEAAAYGLAAVCGGVALLPPADRRPASASACWSI